MQGRKVLIILRRPSSNLGGYAGEDADMCYFARMRKDNVNRVYSSTSIGVRCVHCSPLAELISDSSRSSQLPHFLSPFLKDTVMHGSTYFVCTVDSGGDVILKK